MSKPEHEIVLSAESLAVGINVVYMSRRCTIVGFEDDAVLLHSIHLQADGKPSSSWKVEKRNLIGSLIIQNPPIGGEK